MSFRSVGVAPNIVERKNNKNGFSERKVRQKGRVDTRGKKV